MEVTRADNKQIQSMLEAGKPLPLYRLGLAMEGCATEQEMNHNFFATLDRGYTPINGHLGKSRGACSIVGSGPSIEQTHTELRGDVIAINSSIGFLLDRGIIPKWAMIWDAADICEKFAIPHPDITYLIASRCHPKVFERLKDCKVVVWHAAGDNNIMALMNRADVIAKQPCEEPLINGGTAGVTRTMFLATALGYTELHIYGADSSYSGDKTHINGSLVYEKDIMVAVGDNPPIFFRTTPEWCAQVNEYRNMFCILTCCGPNIKLRVHGHGMLRTVHDILSAQLELFGKVKFAEMMDEQEKQVSELNSNASVKHKEMQQHASA